MSEAAPAFNQELIEEFRPLINKFISTRVHGYESPNVCYEKEDIFQECLIHLHRATQDWIPSRGMKFSSYVYMLLESRMANFRMKVTRRNQLDVINFGDRANGESIMGTEERYSKHDGRSGFPKQFESLSDQLYESNDHLNQILEIQRVFDKLKGDKKMLFVEHFILGKSLKEIAKCHPELKYHTIRRQIKFLQRVVNTLITGKN